MGKNGFKKASILLKKSIQKASESRGFAQSRVLTHWSEIVGGLVDFFGSRAASPRSVSLPPAVPWVRGRSKSGACRPVALLTKFNFSISIDKTTRSLQGVSFGFQNQKIVYS